MSDTNSLRKASKTSFKKVVFDAFMGAFKIDSRTFIEIASRPILFIRR